MASRHRAEAAFAEAKDFRGPAATGFVVPLKQKPPLAGAVLAEAKNYRGPAATGSLEPLESPGNRPHNGAWLGGRFAPFQPRGGRAEHADARAACYAWYF